MKYFDAHCHIQFPMYDEDRDSLIEQMRTKEVGALVVGVDYDSSKKAIALAEACEHLWASVGLHPNDTPDEIFDVDAYLALAKHPKVVAIGECGLDNFRPEHPSDTKEKQREVFMKHIEIAIAVDKPLMIHARPSKRTMDAYEDALDMLEQAKKDHPTLKGDFHFFVGDVATATRIVALGFTVSYTAVLTFTHDYDEAVQSVPLTSLLSETDSPYVAPATKRGERNDPLSAIDVIRSVSAIRGEPEELVRETLLQNAQKLFSLPA